MDSMVKMDEGTSTSKSKNGAQIDYSKVESEIQTIVNAATSANLQNSIDELLGKEKQYRLLEDSKATSICCEAILNLCYRHGQWKLLNDMIQLLAKRRAQLKQVIQNFVHRASVLVGETPGQEERVELIKTLLSVTEGKIFVELERARLTRQLASIREAEGNVSEAADILQTLAVETFGSMTKQEKIAFILEQVRLCLDKHDYVRAHILAKKVSPKAFATGTSAAKTELDRMDQGAPGVPQDVPPLPELKLKYYYHMIRFHQHQNNYLEVARAYRAIFDTLPHVDEGFVKAEPADVVLKKVCWFAVLAPRHTTDQEGASPSDQLTMLQTTHEEKALENIPGYKELLGTFLTKEIVRQQSLEEQYRQEFQGLADVFGGESGAERLNVFRTRITEHNVLVVAEYYSRVTLARLAELLDQSQEEAEKHVSQLVVAGALAAKIDRPTGVIRFSKHPTPRSMLNEWATNLSKLLDLVESSCSQIAKEAMERKVTIEGLT